jgi:hypothetical protein
MTNPYGVRWLLIRRHIIRPRNPYFGGFISNPVLGYVKSQNVQLKQAFTMAVSDVYWLTGNAHSLGDISRHIFPSHDAEYLNKKEYN